MGLGRAWTISDVANKKNPRAEEERQAELGKESRGDGDEVDERQQVNDDRYTLGMIPPFAQPGEEVEEKT